MRTRCAHRAQAFKAPALNVSRWMESVKAYGGRYAILTVQARRAARSAESLS